MSLHITLIYKISSFFVIKKKEKKAIFQCPDNSFNWLLRRVVK